PTHRTCSPCPRGARLIGPGRVFRFVAIEPGSVLVELHALLQPGIVDHPPRHAADVVLWAVTAGLRLDSLRHHDRGRSSRRKLCETAVGTLQRAKLEPDRTPRLRSISLRHLQSPA